MNGVEHRGLAMNVIATLGLELFVQNLNAGHIWVSLAPLLVDVPTIPVRNLRRGDVERDVVLPERSGISLIVLDCINTNHNMYLSFLGISFVPCDYIISHTQTNVNREIKVFSIFFVVWSAVSYRDMTFVNLRNHILILTLVESYLDIKLYA